MFDTVFSALLQLLNGWHLFYLTVGVVVGLIVGVLPGVGGIAGMSILLPFVYGMDPVSALAMLIGMAGVVQTSDTFASVLMGIPGSSASQATILDGFPLAQRGEGARALAASFSASMIGGLFGVVILTAFVVAARPLILLFSSAELFMLTILGLSMVATLSGRSLSKGLVACGLGLLFGTVGGAPATGEYRLTFDLINLSDGFPVVVIGLGLFAVPEIIELLRSNVSIAGGKMGSGAWQGVRDTWHERWLVLRCSGIGAMIGALPGLGGSVAEWVAYGHGVQSSKDRSQFGKGDIRGVIAPESANNAAMGGSLIPTLLFGIPGSGSMAILLGGMVLLGIQPGVTMAATHLDLTYAIIWSLAISSVLGTALCVVVARPVAMLTTVPYAELAPFMIIVILLSTFQATGLFADVVAVLVMGLVGLLMRRFGWPRPPFLIGFVLAPGAEKYLYQAIQFQGWDWVMRPGAIIIGIIALLSIWKASSMTRRLEVDTVEEQGPAATRWPQIAFLSAIIAGLAYVVYAASEWSFLGRVFPMTIAIGTLALALIVLFGFVTGRGIERLSYDTEAGDPSGTLAVLGSYAWFAALAAAAYLVGFIPAATGFVALFLLIRARTPAFRAAALTLGVLGFLEIMHRLLAVDYPTGLFALSLL